MTELEFQTAVCVAARRWKFPRINWKFISNDMQNKQWSGRGINSSVYWPLRRQQT